MTRYSKTKKVLLAVVTGWFALRIILLFFINHFNLFEAHAIASNMVRNGDMSYFLNNQVNYNYQFPVYPYLLFLLYKTFGIFPQLGILLNCIFHSLSVVVGFHVFNWFAENCKIEAVKNNAIVIASLAALGILFNPLINYYTLLIIHPFSLDLFLLLLTLFFMTRYFKTPNTKNLFLLGIVFGITLLDRPIFAVLLIPFFLYLFINRSFIIAVAKSLILLFIGIIFLMPWLYRNYTIYHTLSITSSTGQNLWIGIQEKTGGTANLPDGNTYYKLIAQDEWDTISQLNPEAQSAHFLEKYKQELAKDRTLFLKMYVTKLKNFWLFRSGIGTEYSMQIKKWIPLYKWVYTLVLGLAIYFVIKNGKESLMIFAIPLALSLAHALFYVETRHRVIIEPILLFMAIASVFILRAALNEKKNV